MKAAQITPPAQVIALLFRRLLAALALGASCCLAACSLQGDAPAPEYRLTPAQLAWQPYHEGQVLRFGNARTTVVRTYAVSKLTDRMVMAYCSVCFSEQPKYQEIRVQMQRMDTASVSFDVLNLQLYRVRASGSDTPVLYATAGWTSHGTPSLPLAQLDSGQPLDSTQYFRVKLLPSLTLGATTYGQVLRSPSLVAPRAGLVTALYFTKALGVVGYEEVGTGLWYRLP